MTDDGTVQVTAERIRAACATIVTLWPLMLDGPKATTTGTIGRITGSVDRPLPGGSDVLSLRREVPDLLTSWVRVLMDERDVRPAVAGTDAQGLARVIATHADWLAAGTWGEDAAEEVGRLARQVRGVVDAPKRDYRVTSEQRAQLLDEAASRLHTVPEIVTMAPGVFGRRVPRSTLLRWRDQGRLETVGFTPDGKPLHRVSRVAELLGYDAGDVDNLM